MVWLFFQQNTDLFTQSPKFLHVAPENALTNRLLNISSLEYLSIDLKDRSAMLKMDITEINAPDNYFDIIYCSHVLEHVDDDRKAIDELYRVLKPGGWAAIMVPITAPSTIEDPTIIDPVERERFFGQYDHVRRYGLDIIKRLETGGFKVTVITPNDLANQGDIQRFGLLESDKIFYCLK
jgi:SAM-dependent methyltransferase